MRLDSPYLEPRVPNHTQRIPVQVATTSNAFPKGRGLLLHPCDGLSLHPHVFEEMKSSARLKHPPHLSKSLPRVGYGAKDQSTHHRVEAILLEGQVLGGGEKQLYREGGLTSPPSRLSQHGLVRIYAGEVLHSRRV